MSMRLHVAPLMLLALGLGRAPLSPQQPPEKSSIQFVFLIVNLAIGGRYPQSVNGVSEPYPGLPQSTVDFIQTGKAVIVVDWVRVTR